MGMNDIKSVCVYFNVFKKKTGHMFEVSTCIQAIRIHSKGQKMFYIFYRFIYNRKYLLIIVGSSVTK